MKNQRKNHLILKVTLMILVLMFAANGCESTSTNPTVAETQSSNPNRYLDAVREFADNVLKYGRDTYGPKHTPLFVDGVNVNTHEPVKWINPDGTRWIISNFASQQTLLRTLDGLSKITGDSQYRQAAEEEIKYVFANLRTPNGLFYWGDVLAYDAQADETPTNPRRNHEFKGIYPYYELMWQVDPNVTKDFIESVWAGHIKDWSNLDMSRISSIDRLSVVKDWKQEYTGGPIFRKTNNMTFAHTGMNLCYAAAILSKLSGLEEPLTWSKRLAYRYVETRDPRTGFSGFVYNMRTNQDFLKSLADDFPGHAVHEGTIFGLPGIHAPSSRKAFLSTDILSPGLIGNYGCRSSISELLFSQLLGDDGREFQQWALEELTARGKVAYRSEDNSWIPMLADGTSLEGYVCQQDMTSVARKGNTFQAWQADLTDFWAYALAYKETGDEFMWAMAGNIARGNQLGDIGTDSTGNTSLNMDTNCANAHALLGFLSLYDKTQQKSFLAMAERIGDNILAQRFFRGFFVPSERHTYAKFDAVEALVLLHLYAALNPKCPKPPQVWPSNARFMVPYRRKGEVTDNTAIYTLVDVNEPPLSINEAAAMGNTELVKSLIAEGADINNVEYEYFITPLHRAVQGGYEDIVRLLLAAGADVNAMAGDIGRPLICALQNGHTKIVELLLAAGADVNVKDENGRTPLLYAVQSNNIDLVKILLSACAVGNAADLGQVLLVAVDKGNQEVVKDLLAHGADIEVKDVLGASPLGLAVMAGQTDIAALLIKNGADTNVTVPRIMGGGTLLGWATMRGNAEMIALLTEAMQKDTTQSPTDNKSEAESPNSTPVPNST